MFETHKLNEKGFAEVKQFKQTMADAVGAAVELMPDVGARETFLAKIDEAVFFGTKAIAGKDGNYTEITNYETRRTA
jgi:hypothetical protein